VHLPVLAVKRYAVSMEKRYSSRRQRSTPEQRKRVVEEFEQSGLTRIEFSKRRRLALSTLGKWLAEVRNIPCNSFPVAFQEVTVPAISRPVSVAWAMELIGPTGVTIRFRDTLSTQELALLMRGIQC
jgi:hypothetical protein